MPEIFQWREIEADFTDALLLGNGASIALHPGFHYESIFKAAESAGHLTAPVAEIFGKFHTNDFELVLRKLWHATLVNQALGINSGQLNEAYTQVQQALIKTIRDTHIPYQNAEPHFSATSAFMRNFKTVISLNYDLIVYWSMMQGNKTYGNWFKDCFQDKYFIDNWPDWRSPYGAEGTTLVFYPHGNLALARKKDGREQKYKAAKDKDLLESIFQTWESAKSSPLFVCEGSAEQKKIAIKSSGYLQCVYSEVIPKMGKSLAIYGWGMGDQEQHIIDQIKRANLKKVAISVFRNDRNFQEKAQLLLHSININEIYFFDAESPGCWIHQNPDAH